MMKDKLENSLAIQIEAWDNANNRLCDIQDALHKLTGERYVIAELIHALLTAKEAEVEARRDLGVDTTEDALIMVCRAKEQGIL